MMLFLKKIYLNDYFNPYTITFENPETYEMLSLMILYHYVMSFLIGVVVFTFFYILQTLKTVVIVPGDDPRVQHLGDRETLLTFRIFYTREEYERIFKTYILGHSIQHAPTLEFIWVLIPSVILVLIAYPSLILLYNNESVVEPLFNITAIGNQWYWTYEYNDFNLHTLLCKIIEQQIPDYEVSSMTSAQKAAFVEASNRTITLDSNMIITTSSSTPRLLTTDQPLVLPSHTPIRMVITSADVIHSWAVPAFGVKVDAVPGRLNQIIINLPVLGTAWGQCSELCGINHGFMPIEVKVLPLQEFLYFMQLRSIESLYDILGTFTPVQAEDIVASLEVADDDLPCPIPAVEEIPNDVVIEEPEKEPAAVVVVEEEPVVKEEEKAPVRQTPITGVVEIIDDDTDTDDDNYIGVRINGRPLFPTYSRPRTPEQLSDLVENYAATIAPLKFEPGFKHFDIVPEPSSDVTFKSSKEPFEIALDNFKATPSEFWGVLGGGDERLRSLKGIIPLEKAISHVLLLNKEDVREITRKTAMMMKISKELQIKYSPDDYAKINEACRKLRNLPKES